MDNAVCSYELGYAEDHKVIAARGPLHTLRELSQLEGAKWSGSAPHTADQFIYFPINRLNIMAAEAVSTPCAVADSYKEARIEYMRSPLAWQADVDQILNEEFQPRELLSHQTDFLAFLGKRYARGAFNASEQGTGKTRCGWLATQVWKSKRVLIVSPKSICPEWRKEWFEVWEGERPIDCIVLDEGGTKERAPYLAAQRSRTMRHEPVAIVLNYEVLCALEEAIKEYEPDLVIYDESWRIKTPTAKVTQAAIRIADLCDHVLLLTGTPIGNNVGDLWSQLRCLGEDVMPVNYYQFLHRYARLRPMQLGPRTVQKPVGVADPVGLMRCLDPVWYRATKASCLNLPPKHYNRVSLSMSGEQHELYERVMDEGEVALGNELSLAGQITIDLRLHEICGGFRPQWNSDTSKMDCKPLASCPKIEWLREFVRDRLEANPSSRCIIWGTYTHELQRIVVEVNQILGPGKAEMCWGGSDNDMLEKWKSSFKSRSTTGVQVLVCQLKKMAFGHNLQECDINIYFSNSWSYVVRSQSEDRSHRNGRADGVEYIDLLVDRPGGTIDQEVLQALIAKHDFASRLAPTTVSRRDAIAPTS